MRAHPDGGNNGRCLNKFSGHANAWARGHQGSSTFNADGSRSVRRSPALDQFSWRRAKPRFMTPNATLQARAIAGARYERTLLPVALQAFVRPLHCCAAVQRKGTIDLQKMNWK